MKQQFLRYWLAMNATAAQSAAHAVRAFCGLAGMHQVYTSVPTINLQGALVVFLFSFGAAILKFLDEHPLPVNPLSAVATQ